jgi:hypothetical protein
VRVFARILAVVVEVRRPVPGHHKVEQLPDLSEILQAGVFQASHRLRGSKFCKSIFSLKNKDEFNVQSKLTLALNDVQIQLGECAGRHLFHLFLQQ